MKNGNPGALSQPGYDRFVDEVADGATVIVDGDLVEAGGDIRTVPFSTTAEKVGRKIVANIVMLGYVNAALDLIDHQVLEDTVVSIIPKGTEELNKRALAAGRELHTENGR